MRRMQFVDRINAIEARAQRINLTLWELCQQTPGVQWTTVKRWRGEAANPKARKLEQVLRALEGKLTDLEREIIVRLTEHSLPAPVRQSA